MTGDDRTETVASELELADEELRAADHLLAVGIPRVALARTYFAVFHAARARLYADGLEPRTHSGVLNLWSLHMVKGGRYAPSTARLLARLQKFREEADYSQAFIVDDGGAREELEAARALVEHVRNDVS